MRTIFATGSEIILDPVPASVDSAALNTTDTPTELWLSIPEVLNVMNNIDSMWHIVINSHLRLDATDTVTVTNELILDILGVETVLGVDSVAIVAGVDGYSKFSLDLTDTSILGHIQNLQNAKLFLRTETTTLGTANYQMFTELLFSHPLYVGS